MDVVKLRGGIVWACVRCCCCLSTPMTLAIGWSPIFPIVVHQPGSPSIWPAVQSLRRDLSTNPGDTMWCICGWSWRDDVCCVCECYKGGILVMMWFGIESTLCKYDLRKGDLFVLSWARVRRVRRGSISSELLMCGGGVCSILLLPLVATCLETIDVCVWCMFVFMSVVVAVWGSVGMFVV